MKNIKSVDIFCVFDSTHTVRWFPLYVYLCVAAFCCCIMWKVIFYDVTHQLNQLWGKYSFLCVFFFLISTRTNIANIHLPYSHSNHLVSFRLLFSLNILLLFTNHHIEHLTLEQFSSICIWPAYTINRTDVMLVFLTKLHKVSNFCSCKQGMNSVKCWTTKIFCCLFFVNTHFIHQQQIQSSILNVECHCPEPTNQLVIFVHALHITCMFQYWHLPQICWDSYIFYSIY